jgi:hypothetical protein
MPVQCQSCPEDNQDHDRQKKFVDGPLYHFPFALSPSLTGGRHLYLKRPCTVMDKLINGLRAPIFPSKRKFFLINSG